MRHEKLNYLVAGSFVLLAAAVALVALYWVTGRAGPSDEYHVYYRDVTGLKYGSAVTYEGYRVGQIEDIVPEPDGAGMRFKVQLSVEQGWRIPGDSVARVVATGLISAVSINIEEGNSPTALKPGAEIKGQGQTSLFSVLGEVATDFESFTEKTLTPALDNITRGLDEAVGEFTQISREEVRPLLSQLRTQITESGLLQNTNALVLRLDKAAGRVESMASEQNTQYLSNVLANLDTASRDMGGLLNNIDETRADMQQLIQKLEYTLDRSRPGMRVMVDDLELAVTDFRQSMRAVSENIGSVMYQLDGTTRNLQELSRELRNNPGAVLRSRAPGDPRVSP